MHSTLKMVTRAVVVLAVLALGASVASAEIFRTLTLDCKNLGSASVTITSWTWLADPKTPIDSDPKVANADVTGWTCVGDQVTIITPLTQPIAGNALINQGFTAGVMYTVIFNNDPSTEVTLVDGFVNHGQPVHFRDRIDYAAGGKGAAVVVRLAN